MPDVHGIIATAGGKLSAYPYPDRVWLEDGSRIVWNGETFDCPAYAADWMELVDERDRYVGVQLDMVRDLHPEYWDWLHRFTNVIFTERGDVQVVFKPATGSVQAACPYLPVQAFRGGNGDFILYVPELLRA
jgi:hypothetical protein